MHGQGRDSRRLRADGVDAQDVAALNTAHVPSPGAAGQGGGGKGGTGSWETTTSTPQGGEGESAFGLGDQGGRGGHSGFATGGKSNRRPGGGGGGLFLSGDHSSEGAGWGLVAEAGHDGNVNSTSAITFTKPARGGAPGAALFRDEDDENDFFGLALDPAGELIVGELKTLWAGAGGGAGGDAIPANEFPHPLWSPGTDEKGAGGGGGAGGIRIQALERIRIAGAGAHIRAEGGRGGAGENVIFNDRIAGGSGGGSGGHIVIETSTLDLSTSWVDCLQARGGRGGRGANDNFDATNAGGDGGPGRIQIHVPDPSVDILLPPGMTLESRAVPDALALNGILGTRSRALSKWIPLGSPTDDPSSFASLVEFAFAGVDPATGEVLDVDADGFVDDLAPVLGGADVDTDPSDGLSVPYISEDGRTLVVDGSPLAGSGFDDVYLRSPALMQDFMLVLFRSGDPQTNQRFRIEAASYDEESAELSLSINISLPDLHSFPPEGGVDFSVLPRFLEVVASGVDTLPASTSVRIHFEGAGVDADGEPVTDELLVPSTADASALGVAGLAFFRFRVDFDIQTDPLVPLSASAPRPGLNFLRLPVPLRMSEAQRASRKATTRAHTSSTRASP